MSQLICTNKHIFGHLLERALLASTLSKTVTKSSHHQVSGMTKERAIKSTRINKSFHTYISTNRFTLVHEKNSFSFRRCTRKYIYICISCFDIQMSLYVSSVHLYIMYICMYIHLHMYLSFPVERLHLKLTNDGNAAPFTLIHTLSSYLYSPPSYPNVQALLRAPELCVRLFCKIL